MNEIIKAIDELVERFYAAEYADLEDIAFNLITEIKAEFEDKENLKKIIARQGVSKTRDWLQREEEEIRKENRRE